MYATPAHDPRCREQLATAVAALYRRARSILGEQPEATPDYTTNWLYDVLTLGIGEASAETMATMAAYQIVRDLMDPAEVASSAWWGTPLGRAIVWWVGWPASPSQSVVVVPQRIVCHVLGVTRQRAAQMGVVWSDELTAQLRRRWPEIQQRTTSAATLALVKAFGA